MAMAKKGEKQKSKGGLWIPNHIRNIPRSVLGDSEKMLLAEIYSFGDKGFYKANETIAKECMTTERTVSRWIAKIIKGGFVYVKNPKSYYRTFWAKSHPCVQKAARLWYYKKQIPKSNLDSHGHICPSESGKNVEVSTPNSVSGLRQNCLPTYKGTNKETNEKTKAADLPLPAGGQASQLLEERKAGMLGQVERLKKGFGYGGRSAKPRMTPEQLEQNRHKQLAALRALEKSEKSSV